MLLERSRDLERTTGWFLRAIAKDQRHAIARRQPDELLVRRLTHLRGREHDVGELTQSLLLLLDQKLGITDQVDEEHVPNFELRITFSFSVIYPPGVRLAQCNWS
jgi:hypothetical protein